MELISSTSSSTESSEDHDLLANPQSGPSTAASNPAGTTIPRRFITPRLALALDKAKVSDPDAVHIIAATAEALGYNISDLILSRDSLSSY